MQIRRLLPSDAVAFQDLRLRGLLESPTAFGSSYEEEVNRSIPTIAESLAEDSGRNMFGAFIGNELVGVVGVGRESALKENHRGFIRSMNVALDFRRKGVGKALVQCPVFVNSRLLLPREISQLLPLTRVSGLRFAAMYPRRFMYKGATTTNCKWSAISVGPSFGIWTYPKSPKGLTDRLFLEESQTIAGNDCCLEIWLSASSLLSTDQSQI
jgi:Acetyltransferase (GNAT) domain